jgi:hypothetical protein
MLQISEYASLICLLQTHLYPEMPIVRPTNTIFNRTCLFTTDHFLGMLACKIKTPKRGQTLCLLVAGYEKREI